MPWTFPLGLVSGVFRSPCASSQIAAPGPSTDAMPPTVPSATEWSPPSTSGIEPSRGRLRDLPGDALARGLDLVQEAGVLVPDADRLGHRGRDVAVVGARRSPSPSSRSPSPA